MRLFLVCAFSAVASPAIADTLPLARGVYVATGESCRSPANAFIQTYDGQGIGSSKAADCRARVVAHIGRRYTLRQNCLQYGDPTGRTPRTTEMVKIRVESRTRYTDIVHGGSLRLCPGLKL